MESTPEPLLKRRITKRILLLLQWFLWDFSGLRFIYHKIFPFDPSKIPSRQPSTFFLWVVGIYVALFGIASQRYENRIDRIESRANSIYAQLGSKNWKQALERVPEAQRMLRPQKPEIFNPHTVACSFVCEQVRDNETIISLKHLIVSFKNDLSKIDLHRVDLSKANLTAANLSETSLTESNLTKASLRRANLSETNLIKTVFVNANLTGANLNGASLVFTNFRGANLIRANLQETNITGAILLGADLREALGLTQNKIDSTFVDKFTKLPKGLDLKLLKRKTKRIKIDQLGEKVEIYFPFLKEKDAVPEIE